MTVTVSHFHGMEEREGACGECAAPCRESDGERCTDCLYFICNNCRFDHYGDCNPVFQWLKTYMPHYHEADCPCGLEWEYEGECYCGGTPSGGEDV
jgi:hypothetical protein